MTTGTPPLKAVGILQVEPDADVYHALMWVAAEAGSSTEVESWMMESWKAGFDPDIISFTLMLKLSSWFSSLGRHLIE